MNVISIYLLVLSRLSKQLADETIQVLTMTRLLSEERKAVATLTQEAKRWQVTSFNLPSPASPLFSSTPPLPHPHPHPS